MRFSVVMNDRYGGDCMVLDKRSKSILNTILKTDSYISVVHLSEQFNVSRRTIYSELDKIDDWLKQNYSTELIRVRGKGLYVSQSLKSQILNDSTLSTETYYEFSKEERIAWIYIYLFYFNRRFILKDFQELFQVSRNTVIDDIKVLKKDLMSHRIDLHSEKETGYVIFGEETTIRICLIQYLSVVMSQETMYRYLKSSYANTTQPPLVHQVLVVEEILTIKRYLEAYETFVEIEITDDVRNNLIIWFYFFVQRIKQKAYAKLDAAEKEVIHTTEEFIGAKNLCENLSTYFKVDIPMSEIIYFAKYLLSAKVNYDLNIQSENEELKRLSIVVERMIFDFQKFAAIDFPVQDKMIHNLLLHLKSTYYRKKYGMQIQNVFKDSIKRNYPEVFHITKKVIHHIEEFMGEKINENEVAYIAMHFGGWLRQEGVILKEQKKNMLIVCTNGLGTSQILERQLKELFSDVEVKGVISLREYEEIHHINEIADFVVSTVSLPDRAVPVFVVDPILNNDDKVALLKKTSNLYGDSLLQSTISADAILEVVKQYGSVDDEQTLKNELKELISSLGINNVKGKNETIPDLLKLLPESRIQIRNKINGWEEAIVEASSSLLEQNYITDQYVEEMIKGIKKEGPYIVISDYIALPHAGFDKGVIKTGMSMLLLKNPVDLLGKPVKMFIVLATVDNEQHLKALTQLTKLFSDKEIVRKVMQADQESTLINIMKNNLTKMRID